MKLQRWNSSMFQDSGMETAIWMQSSTTRSADDYAGYVGGVSTMQGTKQVSIIATLLQIQCEEIGIQHQLQNSPHRSVEERSYESLGTYHLPTGETLHRNYLGYDSPSLYTTNNVQLGL